MKRFLMHTLLPAALLLSVGAVQAGSHGHDAGASHPVKVHMPFVRLMPPGQPNTAAFMTLENTGGKDLAVVSAESGVSRVVELHTHTMHEGVMRMREIERIEVAAGARTELKPGGLHVMLIGLHEPLQEGQVVEVTLVYDDGSRQMIHAPVRDPGDMMPGQGHGHGMNH
ncbi:copper chaperone PCu(A)C [Thioalkalivibrio thiocyanodenitrificans]|uniref:copper chaperone PCu(A)C n=1 Tax=Thioalkalivibrio thiocyanodenitrificans TaxID=243063 RepID=UPI000370DBAA|nr:copper chaperone PCu(A)C [Thioalkalivibrio thiocyanodenitrificans]